MAVQHKGLVAGSALASVLAGPALPALVSTPAVADDANWAGFYFGVGAGLLGVQGNLWAYAEDDYDGKGIVALGGEVDFFRGAADPSIGLGFNTQYGTAVFGFALDLALMRPFLAEGFEDDVYSTKDFTAYPELDFFARIGPTITATTRLGMVVNENTLVYLALGGAAFRYTVGGGYDIGDGDGRFTWENTGFMGAFVIGFGLETFVKPNASIGLQYRAMFLPTLRAEIDNFPQFGETEFNGRIHAVTFGINYWIR